jgi:hypothetical protein
VRFFGSRHDAPVAAGSTRVDGASLYFFVASLQPAWVRFS